MERDDKLLNDVSGYLYVYLDGEGAELPLDEYNPEARHLIERAKSQKSLTPNWIAMELKEIFTHAFGYSYNDGSFDKAGEELFRLLKSK